MSTAILPQPGSEPRSSFHSCLVMAACITVSALAWQFTHTASEDVSWLLDLAGRTLDGDRYGIDYLEVNPPASIWLYLPAALAARLLDLAPLTPTILGVCAGAWISLAVTDRILARCPATTGWPRTVLLPLALAALLLTPMYTFGQREHIVGIAILPYLAAVAIRTDGNTPMRRDVVLSGLAAGFVVCIKPMFAVALALPVILLVVRRGWRVALLLPEGWIGAALAGFYALAVLILVPTFARQVLPVALAVYMPSRLPSVQLLALPAVQIWLLLIIGSTRATGTSKPPTLALVLMFASTGFMLVFLQQGKGYVYQAWPAMALALLAILLTAVPTPQGRDRAPTLLNCGLAGLGLVSVILSCTRHYDIAELAPGLDRGIRAVGPRPSVMTISPILALGHPFVEDAGGRFVGSMPSTWIMDNAGRLPRRARDPDLLAPFLALEQGRYAADIARERPDILLVDGPAEQNWIDGFGPLRQAQAGYRLQASYGQIALWARKDLR